MKSTQIIVYIYQDKDEMDPVSEGSESGNFMMTKCFFVCGNSLRQCPLSPRKIFTMSADTKNPSLPLKKLSNPPTEESTEAVQKEIPIAARAKGIIIIFGHLYISSYLVIYTFFT